MIRDILKPKSSEDVKAAALAIEDPNELLKTIVNKINDPELVKIAIERGADPNKISGDVSNITNKEIIRILITNPQMLISTNSLIYKAVKMGLENEIIDLINNKKLNPGQKHSILLVWSIGFARQKLVKYLLKNKDVDPETESESMAEALAIAIARNNNSLIKILLADKRIDPGSDFNRPIKVASQFGNVEAVKMLIKDFRVDPSAKDIGKEQENFAIKAAYGKNHKEIVELLLKVPKVRKKLSKDELKKYEEMKIVKESIELK